MRNLSISILIFIAAANLHGQIGIGTTVPQKALHVSGAASTSTIAGTSIEIVRPTVRVDGLNNTNQSITDKIRPVSVTDKGDLVLSHPLVVPLVMIDPINLANTETDYLVTPIVVNQATPTSTNTVLRSFDFNLKSESLVKFGATTSFQFYKASDGTPLTDGASKMWGTRFRFSTAPAGVSTAATAYFGESLYLYGNMINNTTATGVFYANSEETLFLPAGDYKLEIISSVTTTSTATRITNGGGNDNISIVAYSLQ